MNKRYFGFFPLFGVAVVILFGVICGPALLASKKVYRDWRVRQTRPICDEISMRIEGTHILRGNGYRLLRVSSRWLGGNLKDSYDLRASIRTTVEFKETLETSDWCIPPTATKFLKTGEIPYWYTPLIGLGTDGQPVDGKWALWEFYAPKDLPERIWMRVYFRRKNSREKEQWVDFDFPYFPAEDDGQPSDPIRWRDIKSAFN